MGSPVPHPREEAGRGISRLAAVLARHDIFFFFLLTLGFSWTIYLCLSLARMDVESTVCSRWMLIAGFAPSAAAIALAGLKDPRLAAPGPIARAVVFMLTFIPAFGIEMLDHKLWDHDPIDASLLTADIILVSLAAFVVSRVLSRNRGVKDLLQGLVRHRVGAVWYIVALALWPALIVAGNALASILGMAVPAAPTHQYPLMLLIVDAFVWFFLFGGPLGEEAGWRGFALARLQRRLSPLTASVIVGAIWGLWHVPLHFLGAYPMGAIGAIIRIFDIPRAILFTWVYNRSGKSLLIVMLFHAATNTTVLFMGRNYITLSLLSTLLAICVVFLDKMWRAPKPESIPGSRLELG